MGRLLDAIGVLRGRRHVAREERVHPSNEDVLKIFYGDRAASKSGVEVTPDLAMQLGIVFACVRAVSETIATLPVHVYKLSEDKKGRRRTIARKHWVEGMLRDEVNPALSTLDWLQYMQMNIELRGNAYSEVERKGNGQPAALWPLHPDKVRPKRLGRGKVFYEVDSGRNPVRRENMFHPRFMTQDGLVGLSPIQYAAETVGFGIAARDFGSSVFAGGGLLRTALVTEGRVKDDVADEYVRGWKKKYGGTGDGSTGDVALLAGGIKPETIGIRPQDAQLLQSMQATSYDICRFFRVQPHKVMVLDRATFNNIEHLGIEWSTDSILPRTVRFERALNWVLLRDDPEHEIRFNVDGLLRGDIASRMEAHTKAVQWGIKSPNECRDDEDMNPYDGGDVYLQPVNMAAVGEEGEADPSGDGDAGTKGLTHGDTEDTEGEWAKDSRAEAQRTQRWERAKEIRAKREEIRAQWLGVLEEAYGRLLKREAKELVAGAEKAFKSLPGRLAGPHVAGATTGHDDSALLHRGDAGDFLIFLESWKAEHPAVVEKVLGPGLAGLEKALGAAAAGEVGGSVPEDLEEWTAGWIRAYGQKHTGKSFNALEKIMRESGPEGVLDAIRGRMERWANTAAVSAQDRVTQSDGAVARKVWQSNGVTKLMWLAVGSDTCPLCSQLDGKVIGIEESFVAEGGKVEAEGKSPVWAGAPIMHPPLHEGCVCSVVPG